MKGGVPAIHTVSGRHHRDEEAISAISPTSPDNPLRRDSEARVSIDHDSSRIPDRENVNSDAMSTGSDRKSAFQRKGRRLTASTSYQNPTKVIGAEPGVETAQEVDLDLHARCEITLVDYGHDDLLTAELNNDTLPIYLEKPRPRWATVRWINVNGLSWDVIKCLGQYKSLHRLAIEDIMNTHSRTKTDWQVSSIKAYMKEYCLILVYRYSDHAVIILTLQKLIHLHSPTGEQAKQQPWWSKMMNHNPADVDSDDDDIPEIRGHSSGGPVKTIQTLQRYHGGPNPNYERVLYMERHSSLAASQYAVHVEQCAIFLCDDNTVISFFESSADDIEPPIMDRLRSTNTLLRSSCDGSMIVQAIVDAIVDLCFPIIHAYQDTIGDLELSVLTDTSLQDTNRLYIITSELSLLKTTIQPLIGIVNALRDHKKEIAKRGGGGLISMGISPLTYTYLGDVQDHALMLLDTLETMKRSADNLTDYIFNTVGNLQNENMRQLTIVTIFFLPMSFLTGYFGMNFTSFGSINHSEGYFWIIAGPVGITTIFALMYGLISRNIEKFFRRRQIRKVRNIRKRKEKEAKGKIRIAAAKRLHLGTQQNGQVISRHANGSMEIIDENSVESGKKEQTADSGDSRIHIEP